MDFLDGTHDKEAACLCRRPKEMQVRSLGGKGPLDEGTLVFLPGESLGHKESQRFRTQLK